MFTNFTTDGAYMIDKHCIYAELYISEGYKNRFSEILYIIDFFFVVESIPGGREERRGDNPRDFMLKEPDSSQENQITPMPPSHGGFHHFVRIITITFERGSGVYVIKIHKCLWIFLYYLFQFEDFVYKFGPQEPIIKEDKGINWILGEMKISFKLSLISYCSFQEHYLQLVSLKKRSKTCGSLITSVIHVAGLPFQQYGIVVPFSTIFQLLLVQYRICPSVL